MLGDHNSRRVAGLEGLEHGLGTGEARALLHRPSFVEQGAIAWLLVTIVGAQDGPAGGDRLSGTTFVQRLKTHGGLAPSTGCTSLRDLGNMAFVPYTIDYYFYRSTGGGN